MQSDAIRGKIVDEAGAGLPGVNVIIKGTSTGTTSDANGAYVINLPDNSAGSFVGVFVHRIFYPGAADQWQNHY